MKRVFTQSMTCTQIKRLWRAKKFGDRTRCPHCDYTRKLWEIEPDRWECARCKRQFGLFALSWLD